ncbi:pentapeptide repeat-containing protein [Pseudomonas vanderleydeniana]|uniref:Pentapeptide repeat-containing protein n=1 Tax=Pseudomonas vanderleydeniana TaxID=2745495 RepID=A0A9E6PG06_9PSED|nr:pentapeptide repeat-containing protein [Pseudomonas vanderleydeniana]QXI26137.1 pentapeptide repeat-containing protein [Pseudomonas vanderleydeniana]
MASQRPRVKVKKNTPIIKRPISLDVKSFAIALAKGAGHALLGKFDDLGDDGLDAMAAIGLAETGPEIMAYTLLQNSLITAIKALLEDTKEVIGETDYFGSFEILLEQHIGNFEITEDFFLAPQNLPIVNSIQEAIIEWLVRQGHSKSIACTISSRLPGYIAYSLHKEWQRNKAEYETIKSALSSPFTSTIEHINSWDAYSAQLQMRLEEPVFGEPFGLRQIYIPLNAYYETKGDKNESLEESKTKQRVVVRLIDELDNWLASSKKDDAVRAISGGPGSGKSSFSKIYSAHIASQNKIKVLLVPLHFIDPSRDFIDEIGRFVRDEGILKNNPLQKDYSFPELLIILDGLDELASQGRAAATTARNFVRSVQQTVDRLNMHSLALRVLFSGREVVVQESESEFRRPHQVLTIMPYFHNPLVVNYQDRSDYYDPDKLLESDLRSDWWRNYGALTGRTYDGIPPELDRPDLNEITAQPLLNYLLALSYCRGKLDFTDHVNLNEIYNDLVQAIYERGYENGRKHESIRSIDIDDFYLILEEIGLAAWHGDGRTTTVSEIEQYCRLGGFGEQLDAFQDGAKVGITSLLAAFFFRQHGSRPKGDPTFVFTHKSFGEYLAARRIVRAMCDIIEEKSRRESIGKSRGRGWSDVDALTHWGEVCGPTAISENIHKFLESEVLLMEHEAILAAQDCLISLFNHVLRHGMPMEKVASAITFHDCAHQARNAEETLLATLNACAIAVETVSKIDHPDRTAFGTWLKRIQKQRSGPESGIALNCLSWLDLSGVSLDFADLYGADIAHSILDNIQAFRIVLGRARAYKTSFKNAHMEESYLNSAFLKHANFAGSYLELSNFSYVKADFASFADAKLSGSNFAEATLEFTNFENADLTRCSFRGTIKSKTRSRKKQP